MGLKYTKSRNRHKFPTKKRDLRFVQEDECIKTYKINSLGQKRFQHEFDLLFRYNGTPYIGEVKVRKLAKYETKIMRTIEYGQLLYAHIDIPLLIFLPIKENSSKQLKLLKNTYPLLEIVNIGFSIEELNEFIQNIQN